MNPKYTKDGKKVAVLGKLNKESWIVQELFIVEGQEIPQGENFVVNTLLDTPAETWERRENKRLEEIRQRLATSIDKLEEKQVKVNINSQFIGLINKAIEKYENIDTDQLKLLLDFMSGQITHIIIYKYREYEILPLAEAIGREENRYGRVSCDGLKLVTLFGCTKDGKRWDKNKNFPLDWKLNTYCDGSGSNTTIYPCRSFEEAVAMVDEFIKDDNASEDLIELKEKYNLSNPSEEKIEVYKAKCIASQESNIIEAERKLQGEKNKLENLIQGESNDKGKT